MSGIMCEKIWANNKKHDNFKSDIFQKINSRLRTYILYRAKIHKNYLTEHD